VAERAALSFGGLLRRLREDAGLTQDELAEAARVSQRAISDLERGINRTAHKDTAVLLAGALGLAEPARSLFVAAAVGRVRAAEVLAAMPGAAAGVWNIPARNPGFTGRDGLLAQLRDRLLAGGAEVVQALHGMGGVGKTQLAAAYAHRFAASYELALWIDAEQGGLIGDQVLALGSALGCVPAGAGTGVARAVVLAELRERGRWLLVFDNAETPADVAPWLPGGSGHVLITSREPGWAELAAPVAVDVLSRAESVALLQHRIAGLTEADADRLAAGLGDLPLALAKAAAFMAATGTSAGEYLELLQARAGPLLDLPVPGSSYPRSLAAATGLTAGQRADDDPAAPSSPAYARSSPPSRSPPTCSPARPPSCPASWRPGPPARWPGGRPLAHITRRSLARVDQRGLVMHRLTQAILRDRVTPGQAAATRDRTEVILVASDPGDPFDLAAWPAWARLMPHLLAADLAATGNPGLRQLACHGCIYLLARGDTRTAFALASDLHQRWRERLGADHEHTLAITHHLGWALDRMGHWADARELDQDVLERQRRLLGADHPDTLYTAAALANHLRHLGEAQAASEPAQDTPGRHRRTLGQDHPDTLQSAYELAQALSGLGEVQAARDLSRDTLDRRRRTLGKDHPETLLNATHLANNLRHLGEAQAARDLHQDTLDRQLRVLGQDHPFYPGLLT
jgi:transcriptional regulator with XRE-family HTH domain